MNHEDQMTEAIEHVRAAGTYVDDLMDAIDYCPPEILAAATSALDDQRQTITEALDKLNSRLDKADQ